MLQVESCTPGRRGAIELVVGQGDTARALGSGDVDMLGTPRVVALCEQAAVSALGDSLPEGQTSVSSWMEVSHKAPSRVGATVVAEAVLMGVHGRRLEFSVVVREGDVEVAHAKHRRVLVDRETFGRKPVSGDR